MLVLNLLHFADDVVGPLLEARIARRGVHKTHGRQVVARDMSREVSAVPVPAGVPFGFWFQPGALAVISHHPIRLQLEQVIRVQVLRLLEWPAGQSDRRERQWTGGVRNGVFYLLCAGGAGDYKRGAGKFNRQTSDLSQWHGELLREDPSARSQAMRAQGIFIIDGCKRVTLDNTRRMPIRLHIYAQGIQASSFP